MRTWIAFVVLALMSGSAAAQDGLRSPTLPDRAPNQPLPPAPVDIYRVPPDFYTRPTPPLPPVGGVIGGYWPWQERLNRRRVDGDRRLDELRELQRERRLLEDVRRRLESAPSRQAAALPPPAPGKPKTFYVIPGCYAGDRRPDLARLPAMCRGSQVRVIPPA
jgi:hypothetical protein